MQPTAEERRAAARRCEPAGPSAPGFFLRRRPQGIVVHMTASATNLRAVRGLTAETLTGQGVAAGTVEAAQLVVSELVGNCVRAYGQYVPVVVEVYAPPFGVAVNVHDPDPRHLPRRRGVALDDPDAESGRGLGLLDLLAPTWHVRRSPIGKQIRCHLTHPDE
jgi:anti-sigma regulatory factor (Ser/Thr protein kinase)